MISRKSVHLAAPRITLSDHAHVIRKNHFEVPILWPVEFWQNIAPRFVQIRIQPIGFDLVDPISRHHDITGMECRIHRAGDSGKDDRLKLKMVDCHLGRQCGIDHAHPGQKKVEMLAVKIDQAKTGSIYFLDFSFGCLRNDCLFYCHQFGIECGDDADAFELGRGAALGPKGTDQRVFEKSFTCTDYRRVMRIKNDVDKLYDTDLTDAAWSLIAPILPAARTGGRPRKTNLRAVLNAIFYLLRTGCQWRLLPREFPSWNRVYHYFRS